MAQFKKCKLALAILPISVCLSACNEDNADPFAINVPDAYSFSTQTDGRTINTVDFTEASTRLVLIQTLSHLIASDYLQQVGENRGKEAVINLLNYIYEGGTLSSQTSLANTNIYNLYDPENNHGPGPTPIRGLVEDHQTLAMQDFSQVAPNVNLKSLMPGIGAPLIQEKDNAKRFVGWTFIDVPYENTPNYLIQKWFSAIATLATDGDVNTKYFSTYDYKALIQEFLIGSIAYLQSVHEHLDNEHGLSAPHTDDNLLGYTSLEHQWDMAYGYFGAPVNAQQLTPSVLVEFGEQDANGDGLIHYSGEYIYWPAQNAAMRDQDSVYSSTRFFNSIHQSFLTGRTLMSQHEVQASYRYSDLMRDLIPHRDTIITQWDRALVAKSIHHINAIGAIAQLWELGPAFDQTYMTHWSQLKATLLNIQYNRQSLIDLETLENFHQDLGTQPNKSVNLNLFLSKLFSMRGELQNLYGFTDEDIEIW